MEKVMEIVDSWVASQKDVMDNWAKSQSQAVNAWADATKKMQDTLAGMAPTQDGPAREIFNLYNTWLSSMVNNSTTFADESARLQDSWKANVERQMDMGRDLAGKIVEMMKQGAQNK